MRTVGAGPILAHASEGDHEGVFSAVASALEAYCLSPTGIGERDKMLRLRCTSGFLWTYSACPFGEQGI